MYLGAVSGTGALVTRSENTLRSPTSSTLGDCPRCNTRISSAELLIQYDTTDTVYWKSVPVVRRTVSANHR